MVNDYAELLEQWDRERRQAWDRYLVAASNRLPEEALWVWLEKFEKRGADMQFPEQITGKQHCYVRKGAPETCVELADFLLAERDKRFPPPGGEE